MRKDNVVNHYGTQTAIAAVLGLTKGRVSQWGDVIPELYAFRLERLTNGALKYDASLYERNDNQTASH